jgi:hypothetical protein
MRLPFGSKVNPEGSPGFGQANRELVSIRAWASRLSGFFLIDLLRFRSLCLFLA